MHGVRARAKTYCLAAAAGRTQQVPAPGSPVPVPGSSWNAGVGGGGRDGIRKWRWRLLSTAKTPLYLIRV